jgi:hypothetical protein
LAKFVWGRERWALWIERGRKKKKQNENIMIKN